VLEHDLFKLPVNQIARTKVLLTLFAGQPVYGDWAALAGRRKNPCPAPCAGESGSAPPN